MSEITRADIDRMETNIKDHIDLKLAPITKDIDGHELTLYGRGGRAGLVGDVNEIKTSGKWIKGIAGTGFVGGISKWVHEFFK